MFQETQYQSKTFTLPCTQNFRIPIWICMWIQDLPHWHLHVGVHIELQWHLQVLCIHQRRCNICVQNLVRYDY
jgi:uncharacterized protein YpbB